MKKILFIILIAVLAVIGLYAYFKKDKTAEKKYMPTEAMFGMLKEYSETTGQVEPLNRVEILPPSSGRIEKIFTEEGKEVKAGDVLALMSSQDRVAILDSARAMGDKEYDYWQDAYKPIKIIAPISGRIILRNIVEGQTVSASSTLFAMSDMLIIVASVDEADIGKIKKGQNAFITLDAYPDSDAKGSVFQILDEGKNSNNVIIYKVKIKMDIIPPFFKSQMTANIKIETNPGKKALLVDSSAINYSKDGKTFVITGFDAKKNPIEKNIDTGKDFQGKTEIKKGLSQGDKVYFEAKFYSAQNASNGSSPFMPQRPNDKTRQAMRRAR